MFASWHPSGSSPKQVGSEGCVVPGEDPGSDMRGSGPGAPSASGMTLVNEAHEYSSRHFLSGS